jgi:2-dehydro-3-deoxy-D-arabinonate dehydratase
MHLYKTTEGAVLINGEKSFLLEENWDELINQENLYDKLERLTKKTTPLGGEQSENLIVHHLLPPIGSQEVWAAGVTYLRSRDARMEEAESAGGSDVYQKVYEAERPELFFKALPHRVAGSGQQVYIRKDSAWNVPEPELTLFINSRGSIQAYTIGNDMSSRSIEGENPLYLPQAKTYEKSAALGPCLFVPPKPVDQATTIRMLIYRNDQIVFEDATPISRMKRSLTELVEFLYRECDFLPGCFLMTGTCLVPPNEFTLQENDKIDIHIDGIGTLTNIVALKNKQTSLKK